LLSLHLKEHKGALCLSAQKRALDFACPAATQAKICEKYVTAEWIGVIAA